MRPLILISILLFTFCLNSTNSFAWGDKGHKMVAQIAFSYLSNEAKQKLLAILDTTSIDAASVWMDDVRSNADYDFMKPWHYIDFEAGTAYKPTPGNNIVDRLSIVYNELKHKQLLCNSQVKTDILILFHLLGDLHQPLHTGYDYDIGGNTKQVVIDTTHCNLHWAWDQVLFEKNNISFNDCIKHYADYTPEKIDSLKTIDFAAWMYQSRKWLDFVYSYDSYILDKSYVKKSKPVIETQLFLGGLRLAAILEKILYTLPTTTAVNYSTEYKNYILPADAKNYIGKKVTVCSKVYGVKGLSNISFINVGDKYPNSPLTIVIRGEDYKNFKSSIEDLYSGKFICVTGEIEEFNGKLEIVVKAPSKIDVK